LLGCSEGDHRFRDTMHGRSNDRPALHVITMQLYAIPFQHIRCLD
jgi:hypothetical protein